VHADEGEVEDDGLLKVLLIQIRDAEDIMAGHEHECVTRRIGQRPVELEIRNARVETASPQWLDGVDVLVIGGSGKYSVHHEESQPWVEPMRRLLDRALSDNLPGFGICFGHQLLGMHLGAPVLTDAQRTEIGTVQLRLTEAGQDCDVFSHLGEEFHAQTGHSDHVAELPPDVELLVENDVVPAQAFRVRGTRFYSTQFHPDLTAAEARHRYLAYKRAMGRVIDDAEKAAQQYDVNHDGGPVEELIGRFLDSLRE